MEAYVLEEIPLLRLCDRYDCKYTYTHDPYARRFLAAYPELHSIRRHSSSLGLYHRLFAENPVLCNLSMESLHDADGIGEFNFANLLVSVTAQRESKRSSQVKRSTENAPMDSTLLKL